MVTGPAVFFSSLTHWIAGSRITTAELGWALLLILALVGFHHRFRSRFAVHHWAGAAAPTRAPATAAGRSRGRGSPPGAVFLARRLTRGPRAALIGVAVGVTWACTAALIKSCTNIVLRGLPALS